MFGCEARIIIFWSTIANIYMNFVKLYWDFDKHSWRFCFEAIDEYIVKKNVFPFFSVFEAL